MTSTCLQAAQLARQCGISVVPPSQDGSKKPWPPGGNGCWDKYKTTHKASESEIDTWYSTGITGVGWACGKISGNLCVIDFDDRSIFTEYKKACEASGVLSILEKVMNGYCENTPNGTHVAYRCSGVEGSKKLAWRDDGVDENGKQKFKTLIETKEDGGYIIVAPTHGSVNKKGVYTMQHGAIETITTITPEERFALFSVADIFNEKTNLSEWKPKRYSGNFGDRPGDEFNEKAKWGDILEPHGWVRVWGRLGKDSWRRPGKTDSSSATTNHNDSDLLYVFSSSTCFEQNRGYSKFSAYALLEHNGDFSAAALDLRNQGYGTEQPEINHFGEVDISGIMAQGMAGMPKKERKHPSIDELLRVPGLVGELADWMTKCAHKKQPIHALGASLVAMSAVLGRKVQTSSGIRSNIYAIGIGNTGSGKEIPRSCIKWLFDAIGCDTMVGEMFASATAIETALADHQQHTQLFLIDEIGHFLGSMKSEGTAGHVKAILPMMMKIFTSSDSNYRCQTFADRKRNKEAPTIEQPSLSVWATTVPRNLFGGITRDQAIDGFLNRWLVFESNDPDPIKQKTDVRDREVPQSLIDGFSHWVKASACPLAEGNIEEITKPRPLIVESTQRAEAVFDGLELMLRDKRKQLREAHGAGSGKDGPYMRVCELAIKLALIRSCGIKLDNPEITEQDAQWGADLAWYLTDKFLERFDALVSENKIEAGTKRLLAWMVAQGFGWISRSICTHENQWMGEMKNQIYDMLVESGSIEDNQKKPRMYRVV